MRKKILFDDNWLFHRGDIPLKDPETKGFMYMSAKTERYLMGPASVAYNDTPDAFSGRVEYKSERWDSVSLPHDYLLGDTPDFHKNNALGWVAYDNAWYRKHFFLPKEDLGRRLTLLFEGAATHATVYLNGCLMKHNFCGYTSFEVDITDVAKYGEENLLAVYLDNREHEGWWYEGAGIYRHVWLNKTDAVALDLWGIYVAPKKEADGGWTVRVENTLRNDRNQPVAVSTLSEILDPEGNTVLELGGQTDIPDYGKAITRVCGTVTEPALWDPENPVLYTCRTRVLVNGTETDANTTRFGFRTVEADPDRGLFVNGKHVLLKGVCGHESFGLTGKACPDNIFREKVYTLKEMGANAYRTSHYPQAEALMDAFDENGILVMDETRWFESTDEGLAQLEMLIRRDRNRPSVIMWSVGNEEPLFITEQGRRICRRMMALVRKLDPDRFVMTANDKSPAEATVYDECDIIGINYNLGIFDEVHRQHPDKAIFSAENAATATTRGWYDPDDSSRGRSNAADKDSSDYFLSREKTWRFITDRPWIMGGFQWHAYEYRGEAVWPRLCSVSGAIDLFWQKKDSFYLNKACWTEEPMVHLLPHWNFIGREGEEIPVTAYTNCDEIELFCNGVSLGKKPIDGFGRGDWAVAYAPGKIEAVGYRKGKAVARDCRETTGQGVRLKLTLENRDALCANGSDLALVTCTVLDEEGREVSNAGPFVRFYADRNVSIYSTGSSNTDHACIFSPERQMYAGRVTAAVRMGKKPGKARIRAEAEGLLPATLELELN